MANLRWGYSNPAEAFFQFRLRQDTLKSTGVDVPSINGPIKRFGFLWNGIFLYIKKARKRYKLLQLLWNSETNEPFSEVEETSIIEAIWEDESDDSSVDNRLRNLICKTNENLLKSGIPLGISKGGGKVWLAIV